MHPVNAPVTQVFGQANQASGAPFPHTGKDYGCPTGSGLRTIAPGTVIYAGWNLPDHLADRFMMVRGSGASGLQVLIQHEGWVELFAHCSAILTKAGQTVGRGDIVALSGDTGNTQGAHLHYETIVEPCTPYYPFGRYDPDLQIAFQGIVEGIETGEIDVANLDDVVILLQDALQRISITNENVLEEHKETRRHIATVHDTVINHVGPQLGDIRESVNRVTRIG